MKNNLNHWRHKLECNTVKDFANIIGFNYTLVSRWLNHRTEPDIDSLIKIRDILRQYYPDVTLDDLIE